MSALPGMPSMFGALVRFRRSPPDRADELIEQQDMSVWDIFRTCHISRGMSVIGATADDICSQRVFRL